MSDPPFDYQDSLVALNFRNSLEAKLAKIYEAIREEFAFIERLSVAVYDSKNDTLNTFLATSEQQNPLAHYQTSLQNAPSLLEILRVGRPRVVNDLNLFRSGEKTHTQRIAQAGYLASYTMPMYFNSVFFGFVFFNSRQVDVFDHKTLHRLDLFGHLVALLVINELNVVHSLAAAIKTTGDVVHQRDPETGSHLDRISRFARLIARRLADKFNLNDEYIEHIFMFSPLHDIGKIGIPDSILMKEGPLTADEYEIMKTHTLRGRTLIDRMLSNFGLEGLSHMEIMRNIAAFHHEAMDGSGYPEGRAGDEIPLEARIVAVADVFDALTSKRPYKEAWTNDEAFSMLKALAGNKLDEDCVNAMLVDHETVEKIQQQFREDLIG